jgi:hypothetical protein
MEYYTNNSVWLWTRCRRYSKEVLIIQKPPSGHLTLIQITSESPDRKLNGESKDLRLAEDLSQAYHVGILEIMLWKLYSQYIPIVIYESTAIIEVYFAKGLFSYKL